MGKGISISLCMIVKDEESVLERCLNCAKDIVDEIIIVDTGSKDKTIEIAKKFTDKIYYFKWIQDFAAARNFSFSKATKEYIFYLDADDIISKEDQEKLKTLKATLNKNVDSVTMYYNLNVDKNGVPALSYIRNRLVRRDRNFKWYGRVHNYLQVYGKIYNSDIGIIHDKVKPREIDRNLNIYKKMIEDKVDFSPRDVFYYGNELYEHHLFEEAIKQYTKLLSMDKAWKENKISACNKLSSYYISNNQFEETLKYCFKSFEYDKPRAELTFLIGKCFKLQNKFSEAIFWYDLTTKLEKPAANGGFFYESYWTWIPHVELCLCYYHEKNNALAFKHNELALSFSPDNTILINNKKFFESIGFK
ncbi:glycosyltransferase [Haloimpatiens sp. FM7315]|uniref:glycosyltransferase family 2 protein n=1 Tax=Haloimpatiens sp. FM7315 TaxID=3298609 RepID=UPI0035A364C2